MSTPVSTPCQHRVNTVSTLCWEEGGDIHTDIHTDGLSDQPTRVQEFHMLYGTKNVNSLVAFYYNKTTESNSDKNIYQPEPTQMLNKTRRQQGSNNG